MYFIFGFSHYVSDIHPHCLLMSIVDIHSIDGNMGSFHYLSITNNAVMNIQNLVYVFC